jgi:hypothetical protein
MKKSLVFAASLAIVACSISLTNPAQAGISACGNIDVEADAMCKVEVQGGCTAKCVPVTFEAACAASLKTTCDGTCTGSAEASCTATCDVAGCEANCTADPGSFDCSASCKADADAHCAAQCSSNANQSQCTASCKATFAAECDASCQGTPPAASCEARCSASCQGSCKAESNLSCQINCQSTGYAECTTRLQGGCTADCQKPEGALFCDGNYVDHNGALNDCIAAIQAAVHITVDASAQGTSSCSGNSCQAEGEAQASAKCSLGEGPIGHPDGVAGLLIALGALCIGRGRRYFSRRASV